MPKTKEIHDFVKEIVSTLNEKMISERRENEYTNGQTYEASYILDNIERIIYKD